MRAPVPGPAPEASVKGKRERKLRADVFDVPANTAKAQAIFDLWSDWQRGLRCELIVARRDMMTGRGLRSVILAKAEAAEPWISASKARVGAQEQQMIRAQATAAIASWLSNRQNDVRDTITRVYTPGRWGGAAKRRFGRLPVEAQAAISADLTTLRHELYPESRLKPLTSVRGCKATGG